MGTISTVRELIDLWPSRKALADELGGVSASRIHKWAQAGSIPARYHQRMLLAAGRRGFPVTAELIVRLHDRPASEAA